MKNYDSNLLQVSHQKVQRMPVFHLCLDVTKEEILLWCSVIMNWKFAGVWIKKELNWKTQELRRDSQTVKDVSKFKYFFI